MNYQTISFDELKHIFNSIIVKTAKELSDSPISRKSSIQNQIGFFQGVCSARGFEYEYDDIREWNTLSN